MAAQAGWPTVIAFGVGFAVGALVGVINGVLVSYSGIPAFIATLGTLFAVRSIVGFVTGGSPVSPLPDGFKQVGQGEIFGLPFLIVYAAAAALIAHVILAYSYLGTNTRALGGNREAARASGIKIRLLSTGIYTLSGASAGLAGALMAARLGSGTPTLGGGFELQVIAAVIIGGTSLFGAIGSVPGTLLGALLLSVLTTGLILLGLDPVLQNLALGSILIIAVGLDQYRRHTMFRIGRRTE
jgi:ribose/xylose/arabinose/galactoside ABC-type transport system permease subunit